MEGDTVYVDKKVTMKFTHEGTKRAIYIGVWPKFGGRRGKTSAAIFSLSEDQWPSAMVMPRRPF